MFEGQQYSMPVSCESTSLQVDCSLVLEIVAARQWPNPGQISIALLIGDEVCANNCLSHKLTTKLQVCEKAPTQKIYIYIDIYIYIYISKHIGIRFATKGAEAMDMTKRSTKTMTKSLLESCSTSTLSHAQLTGNISWILTLGSFDSVRFLWMDWEVQKQQQWNGLRSLGRQRPRRIPDHFRVYTSVPQHISEAAGSSSLLRTLEHLLFLWEVCAAMSCLLTPQDPRMGG